MDDPDASDAGAVDVAGVTGRVSSGTPDEDASFDLVCSDEVVVTALDSALEASLAAEISNFSRNGSLAAVPDAFGFSAG